MIEAKLIDIDVKDIRFPGSLNRGYNPVHTNPDYGCVYVTIITDTKFKGYGLTCTAGIGTKMVVRVCKILSKMIKDNYTTEIYSNFALYWRELTSNPQLRSFGPGTTLRQLGAAAIVNALWDLWARIENKPVWKLLTDMTPEQLVSTVDFSGDIVTAQEAISILRDRSVNKKEQELRLMNDGYPAYTTHNGDLGNSNQDVREFCEKYLNQGFTAFKVEVGRNLDDDIRRCRVIREVIGYKNKLMMDANQAWGERSAMDWIKNLIKFKPVWIEEPTSRNDAVGNSVIKEKLQPYDIGVASGKNCANYNILKLFFHFRSINCCQVGPARLAGINEVLLVYFMAQKTGIPVCPHGDGVGLCEMVQHLQMWDYICLSQSTENRMIEYVEEQKHEHFEDPVNIRNAHYMLPKLPGYSTKLKEDCILKYAYPEGSYWWKVQFGIELM